MATSGRVTMTANGIELEVGPNGGNFGIVPNNGWEGEDKPTRPHDTGWPYTGPGVFQAGWLISDAAGNTVRIGNGSTGVFDGLTPGIYRLYGVPGAWVDINYYNAPRESMASIRKRQQRRGPGKG